jgi:ABC-2 type transport system permease protein
MKPILLLTVRQLSSRWRLLLLVVLAALPIAVTLFFNAVAGDEPDYREGFVNIVLDGMIFAAILPIVMMVLSTVAFGHEVEDRTLSYLVLKPVPRSQIVLSRRSWGRTVVVRLP